MKSEFLIDTLDFLDDALLIEAGEKRVNRKKIICIRSVIAMAACLVLLVIAGLTIGAPYGNNPKLLVGTDWRFLREGEIYLPIETEKPNYIVNATQTPEATLLPTDRVQTPKATLSPTDKVQISTPDTRPSVVVTNRPVPTDSVENTASPDVNDTDVPEPSPITTAIPSPTSETDEVVVEDWTSYIAETETEKGASEYGVEQNFVMAWFASALDVEYVEPTPTPTPEPTIVPTPEPTSSPSYENPPGSEPTSTPEPPHAAPPPSESAEPQPPMDSETPSMPTESWEYSIQRGVFTYKWQKRNINANNIGGFVETTTMNGISSKGVKESTTVSVYKIIGVSEAAAVAVKVSGRSGYYMFTNTSYAPETYKSFVDAYGLRNYLSWDSIAIYDKQILSTNVESNKVWNILDNADGRRVDARTVYLNSTLAGAVAMDIELFGYYDIPVALYKEGYVMFSLFGQTHAYQIGATTVTEILNEYR